MKKLVSILLVVMLLSTQLVFAEEKLENVVDLSLEDIKSIYVAKYSDSINDIGVEITGENVKVFLHKFMQNNIVESDDGSVSVAITFYTRDYKKPNIMYNPEQGFYRYDEVLSEKIISSDKVIEIVEELGYEWKVNNAGAGPTSSGGYSASLANVLTFEELTGLSREDIDHIVIRSGVDGVGYSTAYDKVISEIYTAINKKSFNVDISDGDGWSYEISFIDKNNSAHTYTIPTGMVIKAKDGLTYRTSDEEELKKVVENAYNLIANDCGNWSADYIVQAKDVGFLEGVADISYKEPISREKFCEIIYNMLMKTVDKGWSVPTAIPFIDTYNSKVATLYYEDIIKGKGDKIFAPNDYLTREEAATIIDRIYKNGVLFGTVTTGVWLKFDDESEISDWALFGVQNACKQGIMIGTGSGNFAPKDIYTTEQAITSIVRMYHQNFEGNNQE